jgi:aminoglycoside 6'-N-acetyltransferase
MTVLRGERVLIRPMTADDVPRLAAIQGQPGVAAAWGEPELEKLAGKAAGTDECTVFAVELEGEVVGLVQYHEEDDPMYRHAGIAIFLSEDVQDGASAPRP